MSRRLVSATLAVVLLAVAAAAAEAMHTEGDPAYQAENGRLARATPPYPRSRLLIDEPIWGEARSTAFEAVQRIYRLDAPTTQKRVLGFYEKRLGRSWRPKGKACLVSGRRAVVAFLYVRHRRLGVVIDSRGAAYCGEHVADIAQLLQLGYPD